MPMCDGNRHSHILTVTDGHGVLNRLHEWHGGMAACMGLAPSVPCRMNVWRTITKGRKENELQTALQGWKTKMCGPAIAEATDRKGGDIC